MIENAIVWDCLYIQQVSDSSSIINLANTTTISISIYRESVHNMLNGKQIFENYLLSVMEWISYSSCLVLFAALLIFPHPKQYWATHHVFIFVNPNIKFVLYCLLFVLSLSYLLFVFYLFQIKFCVICVCTWCVKEEKKDKSLSLSWSAFFPSAVVVAPLFCLYALFHEAFI